MKRSILAVIEFAENNYTAYIPSIDGIIGVSNTLEGVKKSLEESIRFVKEECEEDGIAIPEELDGEYEIKFRYDLCTFLRAYQNILSKSGLEELTGINQKQLWHYASGRSKPRKATVDKVSQSLHAFANELMQIEFA